MKIINASEPVGRFEDMALDPRLLVALEKMNISKPTDVQSEVIPLALRSGADIIAVAQTGSGKTLAYALPLLTQLAKKPQARALILSPSREMAQQLHKVIVGLCEDLKFSIVLAIGGMTGAKQSSHLKKNPRIIVATPGRMNDHLSTNKLLLSGAEIIVIDEADRMLDMGFGPQLHKIYQTLRGTPQTLMFSASFGRNVEAIAESFMRESVYMVRTRTAEIPVAELTQQVLFIQREKKDDRLLDELNSRNGGVIVFCGNQPSCERVGDYLKSYGFSCDLIHGDLSQGHRNRVIREFRAGEIRILIATDLLARGLDVPHVDHVINFDLPYQGEDFLHRIGRTARAGRSGRALTFVTPSDSKNYRRIERFLDGAEKINVEPNFKFHESRSEKSGPPKNTSGSDKCAKGSASKEHKKNRHNKPGGSSSGVRSKGEGQKAFHQTIKSKGSRRRAKGSEPVHGKLKSSN